MMWSLLLASAAFLALAKDTSAESDIKIINGRELCLKAHNAYRRLHIRTRDLGWSEDLANRAAKWAAYLARRNVVQHSLTPNLGENLYWALGPRPVSCAEAVWSWYNEYSHYNFFQPSFSKATGHFTQLVWKNTKKVGVGIAVRWRGRRRYETYIVALYSPPGNVARNGWPYTSFQQNVEHRKPEALVPSAFEVDESICRDVVSRMECKWLQRANYCRKSRLISSMYCPKTCNLC